MTAPTVIRTRREKDLAAFQEALASLEGINAEHLEAMRVAGTSQGAIARDTPKADDVLGNVGFNAATFAALAQSLSSLQGRVEELEEILSTKEKAKADVVPDRPG